MPRPIALPLLVCLSACGNMTPSQQAQMTQLLTVACNVDGMVVPLAQPIIATLGTAGATAASADLLVHPAVVAACKAVSGVPVGVTAAGLPVAVPMTPAPTPPTSPTGQ